MTLFFKSVIIYALAAGGALFFPVGCATSMGPDTSAGKTLIPTHDGLQPDYLLIYLIHGDASYSFHDRKGRRHRADQEAVSQALEVAEADLFRRYSLPAPVRFFTYFGHEIPERNGRGCSGSYPAKNFSLTELSQTLQAFTGSGENPVIDPGKPFALIMLSTCRGGEPEAVDRLNARIYRSVAVIP